jgi:hypothetical protein
VETEDLGEGRPCQYCSWNGWVVVVVGVLEDEDGWFARGGTLDATSCGCDFCGEGFEREDIVEVDFCVGVGDVLDGNRVFGCGEDVGEGVSSSSNSVKGK